MKSREIKKYLEANDNGNKIYQNLWVTAKAVLRGKFIAINTYIKIKKHMSNLISHLKELEKEELSPSYNKEGNNKG